MKIDLDKLIIRILSIILAVVLIVYMKNDPETIPANVGDYITFRGSVGIIGLMLIGAVNLIQRNLIIELWQK